jgi:multiple sugar transport system ATP-binding protein
VLRQGRITQVDTPSALYEAPDDDFVASLVGDPPINLVPGTLRESGGGRSIDTPFLGLDAGPWRSTLGGFPTGAKLTVGLRPQAIWPAGASEAGPRFPARVYLTEPLGDVTILDIVARGETRLRMVLPQEQAYRIAVDDAVECAIDPDQICLFAQETGTSIHRTTVGGRAEAAA